MYDLESKDKQFTLVPEHEETTYYNTVCPKCNITCHKNCNDLNPIEGSDRFERCYIAKDLKTGKYTRSHCHVCEKETGSKCDVGLHYHCKFVIRQVK